jgi:hypothetical protein
LSDKLWIIPLDLAEANELVARWHRHHTKVVGHKFSIGVCSGPNVCGAAIVGRPVTRALDDGLTLEVTRCVTDGTPNACSMLYGAAARAAFGMGYKRVGTYTLKTEGGGSLRAVGWRIVAEVRGRTWNCPSRPRVDKHPLQDKFRWEKSA